MDEARDLVGQLETATGAELLDLRERLRSRIKSIVDHIYVLIHEYKGKRGKRRLCLMQIHFSTGQIRALVVSNRWVIGTALVTSEIVPSRDLRNFNEPFYDGFK